jgi:hypothetical protein
VPLEVVVNVDHPQDSGEWLDWAYNKTQGLVVPVFSYNLHEARWVGVCARAVLLGRWVPRPYGLVLLGGLLLDGTEP